MKCRNRNCISFDIEAKLHEYCKECVAMANCVMSNARCVSTGNKPSFEQALRIGEHALRIYQNQYAAPEQLEWATMIYPEGWTHLFEPNSATTSSEKEGTKDDSGNMETQ